MNLALLMLQAVSTWYMVGVIWMVQLVHYPLMTRVGPDRFVEYERMHTAGMGLVVIPAMLVELATATWFLHEATGRDVPLAWGGLAMVAMIWASTFLVQVPLHDQLSNAFEDSAHRRLVQTNWLRTIAWTVRGLLLAYLLVRLDVKPRES